MRKREVVWEDPRFRRKRDQPKALKINKYGEAPCTLPAAHVPTYATAAIPSGMTSPPPTRQAAAAGRMGGPSRSAVCKRPPPSIAMARGAAGFQYAQAPKASAPRPPAVTAPVIVATRRKYSRPLASQWKYLLSSSLPYTFQTQ